jgi:hypothetical protein
MTWTFDATSVSTDLAKVRLLIGDTNSASQLLTDEIINVYLSAKDSVRLAAIDCVQTILAKIAVDVDSNAMGMSGSRSQKTSQYRDLLRDLQAMSNTEAEVYAGGTSIADADADADDDDLIQPLFDRDRDTNV